MARLKAQQLRFEHKDEQGAAWVLRVRTARRSFVFDVPPQYATALIACAQQEDDAANEAAHVDEDFLGLLPHYLTGEAQDAAQLDWAAGEEDDDEDS